MVISQERTTCLGLWVLLLLGAGMEEVVEGCSCHPAHPQQLFCSAEIVIRAKISGEKIVSPSNSSSPYMKMIQYEIKMIKMFKGFDKAKDIQYVYTPVFSSLCGVKLDSNNKAGYLLSGSMWSDGRISIGQCDLVESWDNLSLSQKKNLNYRYQMGCECRINTCYTVPCASTGENECLWTDWLLDNSLNGEQARQYACIRRSDTTCSWYRGGPPPEKDFLDMTDPWPCNSDIHFTPFHSCKVPRNILCFCLYRSNLACKVATDLKIGWFSFYIRGSLTQLWASVSKVQVVATAMLGSFL